MNLKLSDWAHIAEIIGGIAIIASLIFVGLEIQGNSREIRLSTFQAITDSDMNMVGKLVENPELVIAYEKFRTDPESMTMQEGLSMSAWMIMSMRHFENQYEQYNSGILPESRWQSTQAVVNELLRNKGGTCWARWSGFYRNASSTFKEGVLTPAYEGSPFKNTAIDCPVLIGTRSDANFDLNQSE